MNSDLIEELRATFEYHPDGYLIRKGTGEPCGLRANTRSGYAQVKVGKRKLRAHRVIYAIVYGRMPGELDHINRDRMDNRIKNLRDVAKPENMHNSKVYSTNTSGFTGVYWSAQHRKWRAEIRANNRKIYLGLFEDYEDAVHARKIAKIEHHPTSPEASRFIRELFPCGA